MMQAKCELVAGRELRQRRFFPALYLARNFTMIKVVFEEPKLSKMLGVENGANIDICHSSIFH